MVEPNPGRSPEVQEDATQLSTPAPTPAEAHDLPDEMQDRIVIARTAGQRRAGAPTRKR
jgi:hypothetical protein